MAYDQGQILVVDDEVQMAEVLSDQLIAEGYRTLVANSGAQAVELYRAHAGGISLVLCDIGMPGMSGLDTLKKFLTEFTYVPVIMVTAFSDFERVSEALRLGAIDYVRKPYDIQHLISMVPAWQEIGRRQSEAYLTSSKSRLGGLLRVKISNAFRALKAK